MRVTTRLLIWSTATRPDSVTSRVGGGRGLEVLSHVSSVDRSRQAQRPRERPTALGEIEAPRVEVHVGTPARQPAADVGDELDGGSAGPRPGRHDAQQVGLARPGPAADARADRGHRGSVVGHDGARTRFHAAV